MNNNLKRKLQFMELDTSVEKDTLMEILYMSIEEGISIEQAIEDIVIPSFDDLDTPYDECNQIDGDWENYCEDKYEEFKVNNI